MINSNISKETICKAIEYINENGIPFKYQSTKYDLVMDDGKKYSPKYVIAVANHLKNGAEISTNGFNSVEAKSYLEKNGFNVEEKQQVEYVLSITAESIESSDERFTIDNLGLGDNYKPLETFFEKADGTRIDRSYKKYEKGISNQTLSKLACQIFEQQLAGLSVEAKEEFPVYRYRSDTELMKGIFSSEDEFKKYRNSIEYLTYEYGNGRKFILYSWNIFSGVIFAQEC